jgi:hypothetical protein
MSYEKVIMKPTLKSYKNEKKITRIKREGGGRDGKKAIRDPACVWKGHSDTSHCAVKMH